MAEFHTGVQAPASPKRSEKATSKHKGVNMKQRNKKWTARLCLKSRKLDLGEYNTHEAAKRAYQVGAFYYNKPLDTTSQSFVDSLPPVPDNLSDGEKRRWVRERARHYALTVNGKSTSKSVLAGSNSLDDSYDAHALYGNYNSTTTSGRHFPENELQDFEDLWNEGGEGGDFLACDSDERKEEQQKCVQTRSPDVELQQERNQTAHQAIPHITNVADSILFALCKLRKQGWNYRLKSLSPVKAGVVFSLPQTDPPLLMTDIIISSFYELREQGWEVHLEPRKRDEGAEAMQPT